MKDIYSTLDRRQVLKGAAGIIGTSLVGFAPAAVLKAATTKESSSLCAVYFWNGEAFVPADKLWSGDSLQDVSVVVHGKGDHQKLAGLDMLTDHDGELYPHHAWVNQGAVSFGVLTRHHVAHIKGLKFRVKSAKSHQDWFLDTRPGFGNKLKEGLYVIVEKRQSLRGVKPTEKGEIQLDGQEVKFGHITLKVAKLDD